MLSVEFLHLMNISSRYELKKGEAIVKQGNIMHYTLFGMLVYTYDYIYVNIIFKDHETTRLRLLKSGKGIVYRNGIIVGEVHQNQFVGEMSFLAWENSIIKDKNKKISMRGNSDVICEEVVR